VNEQIRKIDIFDTTLRDGEQAPRIKLNAAEKLQIAMQLKRLNVDVIEAGFPISSQGDFDSVREISSRLTGIKVAALARALDADIRRAWEALEPAEKPRIHTFISTSDIHIKYQMMKDREQVKEMAKRAVVLARSLCDEIEFSTMDATRSDVDFLLEVLAIAVKEGATILNIPDTVGYSVPAEYGRLIRTIRDEICTDNNVIISVHCHNDLGLAVANSIEAILNGATQVECSVNGIGERAGNAALEEVAMILDTRCDMFKAKTALELSELARTSSMVSALTGYPIQPNKAIVGRNAFAHESGIHQDGILKERTTYEIMDPSKLGFHESKIVLGKHSGRHAFIDRLQKLGFSLSDEQLGKTFIQFKELADRKGEINDKDLEAIVSGQIVQPKELFHLNYYQVMSGNNLRPTATVGIKKGGKSLDGAAWGDGPIDAAYRAIDSITGIKTKLTSYSIDAVTGGKDALGEVSIVLEINGLSVVGRGVSTDVIEASIKAYINALNKGIEMIPGLVKD
jgi:2-isopropylmalate synthase